MSTGRLSLALLICSLTLLSPSQASDDGVAITDHVRLELIAEHQALRPGESIYVALAFQIRDGWHIYWRNPGDSGTPPRAEWELPPEFEVSGPLWTHPERIRVGPLMNYGYSGRAYIPYLIEVPKGIPLGRSMTLAADAEWLVCEEICIPESGRVTLELPVSPGSPPDPRRQAVFDQIRASQPRTLPWTAGFEVNEDGYRLRIDAPGLKLETIADAWFYPDRYGLIEHAAPQPVTIDRGGLTLALTPAPGAGPDIETLPGLLVLKERLDEGVVTQSFNLEAPRLGARGAPSAHPQQPITLAQALLLALLGGLILNLMPCVFPVLSMKGLALASLTREAPRRVRLHGLVFTAGVLATFSALAAALLALRAGGEQVGWGFQLQSPGFVLFLAWLMFALGLMFSGALTVGGRLAGVGDRLTQGAGPLSALFTGALAVIVATPCTAPFMGAALGFALTQPPAAALSVFLALGFGMAAPWLALSLWPALYRVLPRPGPWMERLKQLLAFPMYGTAAWLVWVLSHQAGPSAIPAALGGMLLLAFAAWLWHQTRSAPAAWRRLGQLGSLASAAALIVLLTMAGQSPVPSSTVPSTGTNAMSWQSYSEERLGALRAEGRPVFVNFTAAWCITCLVNERVALSSEAVGRLMRDKNVAYLKGDWTNRDPEITRVLEGFGRSGVPLYLLYDSDGRSAPEILPQLLTEGLVLERLERL